MTVSIAGEGWVVRMAVKSGEEVRTRCLSSGECWGESRQAGGAPCSALGAAVRGGQRMGVRGGQRMGVREGVSASCGRHARASHYDCMSSACRLRDTAARALAWRRLVSRRAAMARCQPATKAASAQKGSNEAWKQVLAAGRRVLKAAPVRNAPDAAWRARKLLTTSPCGIWPLH